MLMGIHQPICNADIFAVGGINTGNFPAWI